MVALKHKNPRTKKAKSSPKNSIIASNPTLRTPTAPIIVSKSVTDVMVLMRRVPGAAMTRLESRILKSKCNGSSVAVATWKHIEGASICRKPEVPSEIPVKNGNHYFPSMNQSEQSHQEGVTGGDLIPNRWIRIAETKEYCSAIRVVGLKPNAIYQFRTKSVDTNYLCGPPSDHTHFENIKVRKSQRRFYDLTRSNISTTFVVLVKAPQDIKIGDAICFVESSRLDGFTVLAARVLRQKPASQAFVIEVIWASRLRKGLLAKEFVAERSVLGPQPFTPGYHTGSILFRSGNSLFNESKNVYRTKWFDEDARGNHSNP